MAGREETREEQKEIPLTAQELWGGSTENYMTLSSENQSLFLKRLELYQMSGRKTDGTENYPDIRYTVTLVRLPFLYDLCRQQLLNEQDETKDRNIPEGYKKIYEFSDPKIWGGAEEAYALTAQDNGPMNWYPLCYPDRIVEIWSAVELTEDQKELAGEKLSGQL